ncbi:MAG: DUF2271 domain-containing protein [Treponema sp.]|nr:DUF2271 domain-containing protein [Treponema sp.]
MKKHICIVLVCFMFNISCMGLSKKPVIDVKNSMELIIKPGENWESKRKFFIFNLKRTPQMAAWIEDNNNKYISTIIVTSKSAKKNWINAPKQGRPEGLPVWNHKHQLSSDNIDTVSTATPKGSVIVNVSNDSLVKGNVYNVYLEINYAYDYNDFWTENNSGVNGQPSLVYHTQFIAGLSDTIRLVPVGHGAVDGSNGNITSDLSNFTSALSIMDSANIRLGN